MSKCLRLQRKPGERQSGAGGTEQRGCVGAGAGPRVHAATAGWAFGPCPRLEVAGLVCAPSPAWSGTAPAVGRWCWMGPVAHLVTLHRGRVLCHLHRDLGQRNTPLPPPTSVCFKGLNRQVLIFEATDPLSTCSASRTPELSDAWSRPKPLPGSGTKGTPPPELQSQG